MTFKTWIPAVAVGGAGALVAGVLGLPVPWLIGPLLAGMTTSVLFRRNWSIPQTFLTCAQVVIGLTVGMSFSLDTLVDLGGHLPAVLIVLAVTTALSLANGYLLARWTGIDRASGFLGCVPGAASAMVAAADQVGADARTVAVLQYVRLLFILSLAPAAISAWSEWVGHTGAASAPTDQIAASTLPFHPAVLLTVLVVIGVAGSLLGTRLHFPSPYVLGPMVLATVFATATDVSLAVPKPVFSLALAVIGVSVGLRFNADVLKSLRNMVLVQLVLLIGLLALSAGLAYILHATTGIDLVTAVMGNIPGALEGMVAIAVDLGVDVPIVAAMHTLRSFALLCIGPWIVRHLQPRPGRAPGRDQESDKEAAS